MRSALLLAILLSAAALAGCADNTPAPSDEPGADATPTATPTATPAPATPTSYQAMGFDGETWPRLDGVTLTVLDHGAFGAFEDAKKAFENLTGATVVHVEADDTGSALNRAVREKGDPTFDIIYGIDNVLWTKAIEENIFEPYKPLLADRIQPEYVFFGAEGTWHATPVDHGTIAVNWDPREVNGTIESLDDVKARADQFVTQDPRTSTPGLGFLLATIATYGEEGWKDYWTALFDGGVLVTSGWTEAYEQHFTAGYNSEAGLADRPIVTSYTTSPAYEHYFGRHADALANVLVAPESTFQQVQTMGIAKGTKNLVAAQAWIEFTLTEDFQQLAAPGNAIYPVVEGVSTEGTFGDVDPEPGTFQPAQLDAETIGQNLERWLREWTDLCEQHDCA